MLDSDLTKIREQVARVGGRIQPLLLPCEGIAKRNAFAHIWLGVKTRFSEEWRDRARAEDVAAFVDWIDAHPNADYEEYAGSVVLSDMKTADSREEPTLFGPEHSATAPE